MVAEAIKKKIAKGVRHAILPLVSWATAKGYIGEAYSGDIIELLVIVVSAFIVWIWSEVNEYRAEQAGVSAGVALEKSGNKVDSRDSRRVGPAEAARQAATKTGGGEGKK